MCRGLCRFRGRETCAPDLPGRSRWQKKEEAIVVDVLTMVERGQTKSDPVVEADNLIIVLDRLIHFSNGMSLSSKTHHDNSAHYPVAVESQILSQRLTRYRNWLRRLGGGSLFALPHPSDDTPWMSCARLH